MADPNIFIVDAKNPAEVTGVVSNEVAAPVEPEPAEDAPQIKTAPRPRKD
jgi:hypothetical protein